jgi:UDP-N-acetylglucosamine 2-epimerase (non-hydrolysing)
MTSHHKKILIIAGTRPEIIKVAPVVHALRNCPWAKCRLVITGQHRELLEQHLKIFNLMPDDNLAVMRPDQTLAGLTSHLAQRLETLILAEQPDLVLSQGDTTTVMVTAMICFYLHIPFAHLEAGLRSGDLLNPFPEEYNRKVASITTALHLAPTNLAKQALLCEGIPENAIAVTGNTVIDALYQVKDQLPQCPFPQCLGHKLIVLTAHRRENFGSPLAGIFKMLVSLIKERNDIEIVYPVHPNPQISSVAHAILDGKDRIHLVAPHDYLDFISLLHNAYLVVSDSGGVQEEAPALGKPVLVLREVTERQESVDAGVARLVGTNPDILRCNIIKLLDDSAAYRKMIREGSPYGDGYAAKRVVDAIAAFLEVTKQREMREFCFPNGTLS